METWKTGPVFEPGEPLFLNGCDHLPVDKMWPAMNPHGINPYNDHGIILRFFLNYRFWFVTVSC